MNLNATVGWYLPFERVKTRQPRCAVSRNDAARNGIRSYRRRHQCEEFTALSYGLTVNPLLGGTLRSHNTWQPGSVPSARFSVQDIRIPIIVALNGIARRRKRRLIMQQSQLSTYKIMSACRADSSGGSTSVALFFGGQTATMPWPRSNRGMA